MPLPGRDGQLAADLEAIIAWGPDLILTLVEPQELESLQLESLPGHLTIIARQWLNLPIPDYGIPAADAPVAALLAQLAAAMQDGSAVLIHCHGGRGRSGMMAARLLSLAGIAPAEAVATVRAARPGAIETAAQEAWVASAG
jgi:protein-tyrosine phosphatase